MGHCGAHFIFYDCYRCAHHCCIASVSCFFPSAVMVVFKLQLFTLVAFSGPMTGFYLYFALTKREFTLGSWRERMIEVRMVMQKAAAFFQHSLSLFEGEKEATLRQERLPNC